MNRSIVLFLHLIFISLQSIVFSQNSMFYSADKDLSSSLVNHIYQDRRNYIWIATEDGLNKFDGVRFTIYRNIPGDTTSLKSNYVRTLYEDHQGRFWVGCINGLLQYNRNEDAFSEVPLYYGNTRIYPHITSMIELKNGEVWMTTSGHSIIKVTKDGKCILGSFKNRLSSSYLVSVLQDCRQDIWIATENHGVNKYSMATGKITQYKTPFKIGANQISSICEDGNGDVFVGTLTKGVFKYNIALDKFESVKYKTGNGFLPVTSLLVDKQKKVLVGTDGYGLKIYNRTATCLEDYQMSSASIDFSKMKIHSLFQDKAGNIWTGLFQKGVFLSLFNPNKFNYWGPKSYLRNKIGASCVMSVHKDRENTMWVGTDNDGLYSITQNGNVRHFVIPQKDFSPPGAIMAIAEDQNGILWLGSFLNGLIRFDKKNGTAIYVNNDASAFTGNTTSNKITSIARDKQNRLWIGTNGGGVYIFNPTASTFNGVSGDIAVRINKSINKWINTIYCDRNGITWIGTYTGFYRVNSQDGSVIGYRAEDGFLPSNVVNAINEDQAGNLWIGTSNGLVYFNTSKNKSRFYSTKDGLSGNVICGILGDEKKNIWVSTHTGISKFIVSEKRFVNYYAYDGLQGNEFSRGVAFKNSDGEMIFGGVSGVTSFLPSEIKDHRASLKLYLTGLYVWDKQVKGSQRSGGHQIIDQFISDVNTIRLGYDDNMFSLEFSLFDFGSPERVYYTYLLEGVNTEWMKTEQGVNRITFTNINYGRYKLHVKACLHGEMSDEKVIDIYIYPPWYLSWWAKTIYFILILLLIRGIAGYILNKIRYKQELIRIEHAKQISEAKLQFFTNISHEIRTPMTLIMSPLERLLRGNDDSERHKIYHMMYRNAQRILNLINQLMDIRKIDMGQMSVKLRESDLIGFVDDLMQSFEYQANKRNIRFVFKHSLPQLNVWFDLYNLDKVIVNILSNAFKFTPDNGEISITISTGNNKNAVGPLTDYCEVLIANSGTVIEEDKFDKIFERYYQIDNDETEMNFGTGIGLHLAKTLIEMQHGVIFARNKEDGQGSEFVIRLPMGSSHLSSAEIEKVNSESVDPEQSKNILPVTLPEESQQEAKAKRPKTNYRVLIVDDEDDIRSYLKEILSDAYKVSECRDGKEALDFILKEKPHLVISDVMMPKMDGITLCRKLKANININHIPIVLLTAKTGDEHEQEGYEIGADAYISKPFNVELLKKRIANLIENRERLEFKSVDIGEVQVKPIIKPVKLRPNDEVLLEKFMKVINDNIDNPELNVEMLAEGVGMSRVHVHRKLKELTNQSARDLIRSIRLQQAAEILSKQKQNISDVAYAVGYSNLSHFSSSFRDFFGMSPSEYVDAKRGGDVD